MFLTGFPPLAIVPPIHPLAVGRSPPPEGCRIVTLNVQHTVKGKEAGLRGLTSQLHFADVLFLQEVGKLIPTMPCTPSIKPRLSQATWHK